MISELVSFTLFKSNQNEIVSIPIELYTHEDAIGKELSSRETDRKIVLVEIPAPSSSSEDGSSSTSSSSDDEGKMENFLFNENDDDDGNDESDKDTDDWGPYNFYHYANDPIYCGEISKDYVYGVLITDFAKKLGLSQRVTNRLQHDIISLLGKPYDYPRVYQITEKAGRKATPKICLPVYLIPYLLRCLPDTLKQANESNAKDISKTIIDMVKKTTLYKRNTYVQYHIIQMEKNIIRLSSLDVPQLHMRIERLERELKKTNNTVDELRDQLATLVEVIKNSRKRPRSQE